MKNGLFSNERSKDHAYFRRIPVFEGSDYLRVIMWSRPTVVDLFCEMGAFSRGFSDAGMLVIAGVDKDWYAGGSFNVRIVSNTSSDM